MHSNSKYLLVYTDSYSHSLNFDLQEPFNTIIFPL